MKNEMNSIEKIRKEHEQQRIRGIQHKIDTTRQNIKISEGIITETPYDAQRDTLKEKNTGRRHAIAGLQKEIRDIQQEMDQP